MVRLKIGTEWCALYYLVPTLIYAGRECCMIDERLEVWLTVGIELDEVVERMFSRSNSGDPEEKQIRSEIHSSLDTIHLRSRPVSFVEEQGVFFNSYTRRAAFKDDSFDEGKDYESYSSRHYSEHLEDCSWKYKHQIPSDHYQPVNRDFGNSDYFKTRYQLREQLETNRLDYLSLSLSPPSRRKELTFYAHESLSFTPSKNVEEMNEEDLHRIVESENNCTSSQEDPKSYDVGGYMPISEGDILGDKYEVCRKLGYGQFSTVWLCHNQLSDDYVAIKVSKSQSKLSALAKDEIKLLECTNSANRDHPGFRNIVQMFDYFCCQSINGNHTAIVLEVMGPSLLHLIKQSEYRGIQLPGVRRIIKQVLQGLEYLHDECGIIHTDLKPENILIKAKEPYVRQMVSTAKKFNELGIALPKTYVTSNRWSNLQSYNKDTDDEEIQLFRTKSYPEDPFLSELVSFRKKHDEPKLKGPMWIDANIEVKIGDMGNATWVNNKYNSTIQTRQYRALEVILDAGYDCPADIWSVGCLAFELATGEFLFYPKLYNNFSLDVDHVTLIWEVLGGIPKYITKRGSKADLFFSNGNLRHIEEKQLRIWKIEDVLVDKYKWKRLDAIPFAGFIEYLIEPDPSLRYTASAALSCEWINEQ